MSVEIAGFVIALVSLPAAIYGLYQLYLDFPGIWGTWLPSRRGPAKAFQVRSTTIKALIGEEETEVIKLRKVRVYKKQTMLESFDFIPEVYDPAHPNEIRTAQTKGLYSIPGTAQDVIEDSSIFVKVNEDEEEFLPLRDHNVVVGYIMTEKLDPLWNPEPPQMTARAPVGSERLVMEIHLPPTRRFKRDQSSGSVTAKVYQKPPNAVATEIQSKVTRHVHDFRDGLGPVEWIRAVILKPPKKGGVDIVLEWGWEPKPASPAAASPAAH